MRVDVHLGPERLFSLALRGGPCTIGRSSRSDVVLPLPEVSRTHAVIEERDGERWIVDRSRNGIAYNGLRVREARIQPGDRLRIAAYHLRFSEGRGPESGEDASTTAETVAPPSHEGLGEMVGSSQAMREVYDQVRRLADSRAPVLLLGETGTGKELVARALHSLGRAPTGPWVAVNCAAIAVELVESELFGHEKGAFTGATRARVGAFEAAKEGTLFLDEIGEMPLGLQPKLLRVLESSEIVRVGGSRPVRVAARVIAATNRRLVDDVEAGRFRRDLYYRLCVVPIALPPLSARSEDVDALAAHFASEEPGAPVTFGADALELLRGYAWPGNVRELRNLVRRLAAGGRPGPFGADAVRAALEADRRYGGESMSRTAPSPAEPAEARTLREVERLAIVRALQDCSGNRQATARRLGIAPATLYEKIRLYGLRDVR